MLLILVAARFEMCRNGAVPTSWSRHIDLAAAVWQFTATSLNYTRFADALVEKGGRQGVSHAPVQPAKLLQNWDTTTHFFRSTNSFTLVHLQLANCMNTTHASIFGQKT